METGSGHKSGKLDLMLGLVAINLIATCHTGGQPFALKSCSTLEEVIIMKSRKWGNRVQCHRPGTMTASTNWRQLWTYVVFLLG